MIDLVLRLRRLGPIAAAVAGSRSLVLVTAPDAVRHVLTRHPDRYVKRSHRARALIGDGLLAAEGEQWRTQRRILQARFAGHGIEQFTPSIAAAADRLTDRWRAAADRGQDRDLGADMQFFTLDTIWRALTGHPLDEDTARDLHAACASAVAALPTSPAASNTELPPGFAADLARIDAIAAAAIAAARSGRAGPHGRGLLHVLLDAAAEHPQYTDRLVRDELVTLLIAGHETTATTLTWLHLLLDRRPEWCTRALDAGPAGSPARTAAIRALVSETLRLYPAAWFMPRYATEDDEIGGLRIEAGSTVLVCPYLTHRDPAVWPGPEQFRPDRFLDPAHRPVPGGYYPFGLGPRACLGARFTVLETTALLERLLPAFTVRLHHPPADADADFGIVVRPRGDLTATITRTGR
ncbi:cytochrome P450 [Kitasatospora sp. NPDC059571]|uniref:cytochrome P450 n=1 Tax=Kitasatospora sp. NPDC059571 TaxID=3346871 RepID=UPI00367C0794